MKKKTPTSPFDVTSHAIACQVLGKDPKKAVSVHEQQNNIAKAMNKLDKFKPSFKKPEQWNWRPFFYVDASGFRFFDSSCDFSYSGPNVGSRLCMHFRTQEISDFFGKKHLSLHKKAYHS